MTCPTGVRRYRVAGGLNNRKGSTQALVVGGARRNHGLSVQVREVSPHSAFRDLLRTDTEAKDPLGAQLQPTSSSHRKQ